jgi:hypothetical protein
VSEADISERFCRIGFNEYTVLTTVCMKQSIIVWDLETVPDLGGFAAGRALLTADTRSPSGEDAELLLDVGHHRVHQARLAEFREILSDGVLP